MLKKGDLILILFILILSATVFFFRNYLISSDKTNKLSALIIQNNNVVKEIDLSNSNSQQRFELDGDYKNTILVDNNSIRFENATCPDKICVKEGWLSHKGDIAVCLPNKVMIKIQGQNNKIDGSTY